MLIYLFIGLFVGAINTIYKVYLKEYHTVQTEASVLTFITAVVIWPLVIPLMIHNQIKLNKKV